MRYLFFSTLLNIFLATPLVHSASPSMLNAGLEKEGLKVQISALETKIKTASTKEKGPLEVQLAELFYKDQNPEKAFAMFLTALEDTPLVKTAPILPLEESFYQKALDLYLNHNSGSDVQLAAETLIKEYEPTVKSHPDYIHLNYLIAAAYANQGDFLKFFDAFYRSFRENGSHYLADRTRAILHLKLFEGVRSIEEKELQRDFLQKYLSKALEKYPRDLSLYKLKIVFARDENRSKELEASLQKILSENMITPRADVIFYVAEALSAKQKELAQKIVVKAREWYPSSRLLNTAQEMIDQAP